MIPFHEYSKCGNWTLWRWKGLNIFDDGPGSWVFNYNRLNSGSRTYVLRSFFIHRFLPQKLFLKKKIKKSFVILHLILSTKTSGSFWVFPSVFVFSFETKMSFFRSGFICILRTSWESFFLLQKSQNQGHVETSKILKNSLKSSSNHCVSREFIINKSHVDERHERGWSFTCQAIA